MKLTEFLIENKDFTDRVVKNGNKFYVDREDVDTGKTITKPGQRIAFTHNNKQYTGTVSSEARGRDDDVYKVSTVQLI